MASNHLSSRQADPIPNERFIKLKEVRSRTALSETEIYRRMAAGTFPKPIKIGVKAVAWLNSDIRIWINNMIAKAKGM